jgi:hypothetical protein
LTQNRRIFLDIRLIGKGQVGLKKPVGKIAESSQGKFIYGIIIKNIIQGPEYIKDYYGGPKKYNEFVFAGKTKKIKKIFVPARIDHVGI